MVVAGVMRLFFKFAGFERRKMKNYSVQKPSTAWGQMVWWEPMWGMVLIYGTILTDMRLDINPWASCFFPSKPSLF